MGLRRADIQMKTTDLELYYEPAAKRVVEMADPSALGLFGIGLDALLGVSIYDDWIVRSSSDDEPMPEDWIQFLKQLAGPYGKAILKTYQIKYGVEHANTDG